MNHSEGTRIDVLTRNEYSDGENSIETSGSEEPDIAGESFYENEENLNSTEGVDHRFKSIEEIPWFHRGMNRNAAEAILLTNAVEGTYLLRESKGNPGQYTVSVRYSNSVKHFSLSHQNNVYKFGIGEFDSLAELMEHFYCLPVLGTETGGTVTLRHPYLNNIPEPHVYEKIVRHAEGGNIAALSQISSKSIDLHIASKEGYLVKRGAIRKNWKKRWFVLHKNELRYFKLKTNRKPIRTLNLEDALDVNDVDTMGKLNCFSLSFPWRTFFLYACNSKEAGDWIRILRWKLDYYRKRKNQSPDVDPLASVT